MGNGQYGIVFKAVTLGNKGGKVVAVKKVEIKVKNRKKKSKGSSGNKMDNNRRDLLRQTLREMEILKKCDHKHIVKYIDSINPDNNRILYLVMDFYGGGDLDGFIDHHGALEEEDARRFAKQIWSGLCYLHGLKDEDGEPKPVIHRDLKPKNILMTEKSLNATLKIADFGESQYKKMATKQTELQTVAGTSGYSAPELLRQRKSRDSKYRSRGNVSVLFITLNVNLFLVYVHMCPLYNIGICCVIITVDLWSLGVIVFQMLVGDCDEHPYVGDMAEVKQLELLEKIEDAELNLDDLNVRHQCKRALEILLQKKQENRGWQAVEKLQWLK